MTYTLKRRFFKDPIIMYSCEFCKHILESNLSDAGSPDTCPLCKKAFIVPGAEYVFQLREEQLKERDRKILQREQRRQRFYVQLRETFQRMLAICRSYRWAVAACICLIGLVGVSVFFKHHIEARDAVIAVIGGLIGVIIIVAFGCFIIYLIVEMGWWCLILSGVICMLVALSYETVVGEYYNTGLMNNRECLMIFGASLCIVGALFVVGDRICNKLKSK